MGGDRKQVKGAATPASPPHALIQQRTAPRAGKRPTAGTGAVVCHCKHPALEGLRDRWGVRADLVQARFRDLGALNWTHAMATFGVFAEREPG